MTPDAGPGENNNFLMPRKNVNPCPYHADDTKALLNWLFKEGN